MGAGVSKSGSPAANPITGTPAWRSAVAWSVIAMVLEGLRELTLGLTDHKSSIEAASDLTTNDDNDFFNPENLFLEKDKDKEMDLDLFDGERVEE